MKVNNLPTLIKNLETTKLAPAATAAGAAVLAALAEAVGAGSAVRDLIGMGLLPQLVKLTEGSIQLVAAALTPNESMGTDADTVAWDAKK